MATAMVAQHRTALITGASGGIGVPTAQGLLRSLPTLEMLLLCNRNVAKSEEVVASLHEIAPNVKIIVVPLDLGKLSSVRECARAVDAALEGGAKLDVAVFNAGVMACPVQYTAEDVEYQYGVNHLGHALLALSLRSRLGRAVFVSSRAVRASAGRTTPPLVEEKMRGFDEASYSRITGYSDSKLAMSMFARGLALQGVDAVSLHPGVVDTELTRHILPTSIYEWWQRDGMGQGIMKKALNIFGFKTPVQGAELSVHLAVAVEGEYKTGALYMGKNSEASRSIAPLLVEDEECRKLTDDTIHFLEKYVAEQEDGASIQLGA